jgi:hypothetical protein
MPRNHAGGIVCFFLITLKGGSEMDLMEPQEVQDVDLAFGGNMEELLPPYKEIPDEFKDNNTEWNRIVSQWFFQGLPGDTTIKPKEGIDPEKAVRHVAAVLRSFQPKHEHKEAGCAYLLSLWFDKFEVPKE